MILPQLLTVGVTGLVLALTILVTHPPDGDLAPVVPVLIGYVAAACASVLTLGLIALDPRRCALPRDLARSRLRASYASAGLDARWRADTELFAMLAELYGAERALALIDRDRVAPEDARQAVANPPAPARNHRTRRGRHGRTSPKPGAVPASRNG